MLKSDLNSPIHTSARKFGVFISHSNKDRAFAESVATDLKKRGIDVWFDGWELELGDDLTRKIQEGVQSHQYLLVVLSPDAVESKWVNVEWTAAFIRGIEEKRVTILPLLYRSCEIPLFLKRLVSLDFRDATQYEAQLQTLVKRLGGKTTKADIPVESAPLEKALLTAYLQAEVRYSEGRYALSLLSSAIRMTEVYQIRLLLKQMLSTSPRTESDMLELIRGPHEKRNNIFWISGEPGIGKTWLIHRWRSRLGQDKLDGRATGRVPIYLNLGDLSNRLLTQREKLPASLPQAIRSLPDYMEVSVCSVLDESLRNGEAVVFLDGRDEIAPHSERSLAEWVAQQQLDYPKTPFVITTRPSAHWWQRDVSDTYEVLPLDEDQITSFIQQWFGNGKDELAERINIALKRQPSLAKLARNPMLLTMFCMTWEKYGARHSQTPRITDFYEHCARFLLEDWDRVEHAKLDRAAPPTHSARRASVDEKLAALTQVAVASFPRTTITGDTVRDSIREVLPSEVAPEDVIEDIETNAGLLRCPDSGLPSYKRHWAFSHLTFAEFFAARGDAFANKEQPSEALATHFWDPQWENRIAMAVELRPEWRVPLVSSALKHLPEDIGRVAKVSSGNLKDRFVILVDMCVDNWSGRMNIVRTLRPLIATGITTLITCSGADGFIDTSWFKAFPDDDVRREVALHFVKKLEITGVEYLSITTSLEFTIWGTEDRELYIKQLNLFNQGNRWCPEYHALYAKRAEFAAKTILDQMEHHHVQMTAMTAEPLLLWEMEKELGRIGVPHSTIDPFCDTNAGDFDRYLAVMRNEKAPFEELLGGAANQGEASTSDKSRWRRGLR